MNQLSEEEMELWNKIGEYDPLLFVKGYSPEKIDKIIKELDERSTDN